MPERLKTPDLYQYWHSKTFFSPNWTRLLTLGLVTVLIQLVYETDIELKGNTGEESEQSKKMKRYKQKQEEGTIDKAECRGVPGLLCWTTSNS